MFRLWNKIEKRVVACPKEKADMGMWYHEKTWGRNAEKGRRGLQHSVQLEISA